MTGKVVDKVDPACGLRRIRALIRPRAGRVLVAIDGVDGAGKTTFADDLAELMRESGATVIRISLDNYLNPQAKRYAQGRFSGKGYFEDSYDYDRFTAEVLEPLSSEGSGRYRTAAYDAGAECEVSSPWQVAPNDAVVIVDGLFMHRKAWCPQNGRRLWDLSVWLDVPFDEAFRRLAERDGRSPDLEDPVNSRHYHGQLLYLSDCDPGEHADVVVDATNPRAAADD
jgi:uridine kinase